MSTIVYDTIQISRNIWSMLYLQDLLSLRILFNLEYPFQFTYIFLLAGKSIEWIAHVFFLSLLVFNTHIDLLCLRHKSKEIFNLQWQSFYVLICKFSFIDYHFLYVLCCNLWMYSSDTPLPTGQSHKPRI